MLAAGLPLVIGLTLAFLLHHVYLLALAGLSPVLLIGGALTERGGRGRTSGQPADEAGRRARIEGDARAALDAEQAARREQCPDPATALGIASGRAGACGSGVAPTLTTCSCASARPISRSRWK